MNQAWALVSPGRHADTFVAPAIGGAEVTQLAAVCSRDHERAEAFAAYTRQVEAFNHAIQHDEEPIASGLDGLHVVQATMAMIESASTGRTVKIEPLSVA